MVELEAARISFAIYTLEPGHEFRSNDAITKTNNKFYVAIHNDIGDVPIGVSISNPDGKQVALCERIIPTIV